MAKNYFSECLAKPKDSQQHQQLREELWLCGPEYICKYYLSVLTKHDFFDATDDVFLTAVREYLASHACPEAVQFCVSTYHLMFLIPFLMQQWELAEGNHGTKQFSMEERALVMLVNNPDWTDETIREAVGTTEKQMKRWSTFRAARAAQKHYQKQIKGWC
jgi:hypothetical protein